MFCNKCGQPAVSDSARFCARCGAPMPTPPQGAAAPPPPPQAAPPPAPQPLYQPAPPPQYQPLYQPMPPPPLMQQPPPTEQPPAQPPQEQEEENALVVDILKGEMIGHKSKSGGLPEDTVRGYWIITNRSIIFYVHNWYTEDDLDWDSIDMTALDDDLILTSLRYKNIHSIAVEKILSENENTIYHYSGGYICVMFSGKTQKRFVEHMEKLIPGITFVKRGLSDYGYEPSISELDPRNPYGSRYNPAFPRTYVVAYTKGFPKNFNAIDDAINAAKKDGILPADWNLAVNGVSREKPIPGVPMLMDAVF